MQAEGGSAPRKIYFPATSSIVTVPSLPGRDIAGSVNIGYSTPLLIPTESNWNGDVTLVLPMAYRWPVRISYRGRLISAPVGEEMGLANTAPVAASMTQSCAPDVTIYR